MKIVLIFSGGLLIGVILLFAASSGEDNVPIKLTSEQVFTDPDARDLARAAARNKRKRIDALLAKKVDINYAGQDGITPLWWAIMSDNYEGFSYLLEKGADPNVKIHGGWDNIMQMVSRYPKTDYLTKVLEKGGDPNHIGDASPGTPLGAAIENRRIENVKVLIKAGANLNFQRPIDGKTPAMFAVLGLNYDIAYLLVQSGADTSLRDARGDSLKDWVNISERHDEHALKLLEVIKKNEEEKAKGEKPPPADPE